MADNPLASMNPFSNISLGSMSLYALIGIIIAVAVLILSIIGFIIFIIYIKKQYYIRVKTFRLVGNTPTQVGFYTARDVPFGMAGDRLWKVSGAGWIKIKALKWLPVGKIQSAPNEFWYWIRKDGEWINFCLDDIDEISKKMNVRFVQEDMRLQRLATDRLLEQRHMKQGFWDKYQNIIMSLIFFLIIAISLAIIFYQFSAVVDKMKLLVSAIKDALELVQKNCVPSQQGLIKT